MSGGLGAPWCSQPPREPPSDPVAIDAAASRRRSASITCADITPNRRITSLIIPSNTQRPSSDHLGQCLGETPSLRPVGIHHPETRIVARAAEIRDPRAIGRPVRKCDRLRHLRQRPEPASVGADEVEVIVAVRVGMEGDGRAPDRRRVGRRQLDGRRRGRPRGSGRSGRSSRPRRRGHWRARRYDRGNGHPQGDRASAHRSKYTDEAVFVPTGLSCGGDRARRVAA